MHFTPGSALELLVGREFVEVGARGSLTVEIYRPEGVDRQTPHDRDEIYVVISGSGWFVNGEVRHRFSAGDVMVVPARLEHRFEEFSDDFATWVFFYGPEGGEVDS